MEQPLNNRENVTASPPSESTQASQPAVADPPSASLTGSRLNWILFLLVAVGLYFLMQRWGFDGLLRAAMVALGLGFIIFIHELGHFLAAKWCDVHVQTFSIGFGPALPGCSFVWGETVYKIAAFPLGGFVQMVGEGPEADEDENYPRSFKNKSVKARMLIISAGVIMNMIFAAIVFIGVYLTIGERRDMSVIGSVDAGAPAWVAGVRPGWEVTKLGDKVKPYYDELKMDVALSQREPIPFRFKAQPGVPDAPEDPIELYPHRDRNNKIPVIGVQNMARLKLVPPIYKKDYSTPADLGTVANHARALELAPEEHPIASSEAESDELIPLTGADPWLQLGKRMTTYEGKDFTVRVQSPNGKTRDVTQGPIALDFSDTVEAVTDPDTPDKPFNFKPVSSVLDFRHRMVLLAGKTIAVRVKRDKTSKEKNTTVDVLVPPAFHMTFGMRMKMGKVAAIRDGSPAQKQVQVGDVINEVKVRYHGGEAESLSKAALDPVRLPDELYRHIAKDKSRDQNKWEVLLEVSRTVGHNENVKVVLDPMKWDPTWWVGDEGPFAPASPISIPQLGIAYRVECIVAAVEPGSPAANAGILSGDEIREIRFQIPDRTKAKNAAPSWSKPLTLQSIRDTETPYDRWAYYFQILQGRGQPTVQLEVWRRNAKVGNTPIELTATPDESWPAYERGLLFDSDSRQQVATGLIDAVGMGLDKTWRMTKSIYLTLSSLLSRRIDASNLGGPIAIASTAFSMAEDLSAFLLFLGIISINLAVVNFLPIPILDGGHMVFLIYEGIVGKPPPEIVRVIATYAGLAIILLLMLFVFYNDFDRNGWIPGFLRIWKT